MSTKTGCTVTCDRCLKSETYSYPISSDRFNLWGYMKYKHNLGGAEEMELDLCQDCCSLFRNWMWA